LKTVQDSDKVAVKD